MPSRAAVGAKGARGAKGTSPTTSTGKSGTKPRNASSIPITGQSSGYGEKQLPTVSQFKGRLDDALELINANLDLNRQISELEETRKANSAVIRSIMEDINSKESWSVRDDEGKWTLSYVRPKPKQTLIKEKLVEQGVTLKQIQKATVETPVSPYVSIAPRKQKPESDEEDR